MEIVPPASPTALPTIAYLAEAATIVRLDLTTNPPTETASLSLPDCQPLAMRYFEESPTAKWLFIAGGALGLWRVDVTSGMSNAIQVQAPIEGIYFERKRCVDVVVLENCPAVGGQDMVFGLFAASSWAPDQSGSGATELRGYTWAGTYILQVASLAFDVDSTFPHAHPAQVGTSLAVDPADNDSVYLALGKGGVFRVDASVGSPVILASTNLWDATSGLYSPEHVRDIEIVRVMTPTPKSILYAALNYGEILESTDLGSNPVTFSTSSVGSPASYAEVIAAQSDGGTKVLVAVATQWTSGKSDETRAPFMVNGGWFGICLQYGVDDPDDPGLAPPPPGGLDSQLRFYERDFSQPTGSLTYKPTATVGHATSTPISWNNAIIGRAAASGGNNRIYVDAQSVGFQSYEVNRTAWTTSQVGTTFLGEALGVGDTSSSYVNPGLIRGGQEYGGAVLRASQLPYISQTLPFTISTVPVTKWSPCDSDYNYQALPASLPTGCSPKALDPGLYAGSIFEEAHWIDPFDPNREFFLPGRVLLGRFTYDPTPPGSCTFLGDCSPPKIPCVQGVPQWYLGQSQSSPTNMSALRLTRLSIPSSMPTSGPSLDPKWWQILPPHYTSATSTEPSELFTVTGDLTQSIVDTRTTNGLPNVAYVTRSGTSYGVKAIKPSKIVEAAYTSCPPSWNGIGEQLALGVDDYRSLLTHLELEGVPQTPPQLTHSLCLPIADCGAGDFHIENRQLFNEHTDFFSSRDLGGTRMYVLAIASGFVDSASGPPPYQNLGTCNWVPHAGRPMLVLVSVTGTGDGVNFRKPEVLRVALGSGPGNAISVKTRTYASSNRTYAFVGDIMGKLMVFDVTGSSLLPPPSTPYLTSPGVGSPILSPVIEIPLPRDPFDGKLANCIDLEVIGDYLYCALGRLGLGIVNIQDPAHPVLVEVLDTPGLVLGVSKRTVGGATQLIVGDTRGGLRLYQ
jgi:hypothetical protein